MSVTHEDLLLVLGLYRSQAGKDFVRIAKLTKKDGSLDRVGQAGCKGCDSVARGHGNARQTGSLRR
jgi:hypothetical protein